MCVEEPTMVGGPIDNVKEREELGEMGLDGIVA